jgi:DNA repair photolyase
MDKVSGTGPAIDNQRRRGRGAITNLAGRFEKLALVECDDGWASSDTLPAFKTEVFDERARTIIATNDSPDISFDRSINPYRGCEHGCVYCYARPTHCYLGHSAGLDFETKIYAKVNAAEVLEKTLAHPGYVPKVIALGAVTDPYQPIEKQRRITRAILEVLSAANHPVGIVTKSALVVRDLDILSSMAQRGLVRVALSVTTLDRSIARAMEPRAATPQRRLEAIKALVDAGVPTSVMVAPIIPGLTDAEIERILAAARAAGALHAGYVLLRLPLELKEVFRSWLGVEFPDRAKRVIHLLRSMYNGTDYDSTFGHRQRGAGPYADQIGSRFRLAVKRLGMNDERAPLRVDLFERPVLSGGQYSLL